MFFDDVRAALFALLNNPVAVASVVFLAGMHVAIWLVVFERVGFPPVLASLMLVPPLTFLMPVFLALARWPDREKRVRFSTRHYRPWRTPTRPVRRVVQQRRPQAPWPIAHHRRPLILDADGLPRVRIPFEPSTPVAASWPPTGRPPLAFTPRPSVWQPQW